MLLFPDSKETCSEARFVYLCTFSLTQKRNPLMQIVGVWIEHWLLSLILNIIFNFIITVCQKCRCIS